MKKMLFCSLIVLLGCCLMLTGCEKAVNVPDQGEVVVDVSRNTNFLQVSNLYLFYGPARTDKDLPEKVGKVFVDKDGNPSKLPNDLASGAYIIIDPSDEAEVGVVTPWNEIVFYNGQNKDGQAIISGILKQEKSCNKVLWICKTSTPPEKYAATRPSLWPEGQESFIAEAPLDIMIMLMGDISDQKVGSLYVDKNGVALKLDVKYGNHSVKSDKVISELSVEGFEGFDVGNPLAIVEPKTGKIVGIVDSIGVPYFQGKMTNKDGKKEIGWNLGIYDPLPIEKDQNDKVLINSDLAPDTTYALKLFKASK